MYIHDTRSSTGGNSYEAFLFQNLTLKPQFHRNYEVMYVFEGSVNLTVDGRNTVVEAGDFALFLSNEVHEMVPIGFSKCWFGVFSDDFVPEFHKAVTGKTASDCRFHCDDNLMPFLQDNLLFPGIPCIYRLRAALYILCGEYLRSVTLVDRTNPEYALMNDIVNFISENYQKKLILKDVAHALGYDYFYFSKLFHQTFGQSFNDYLSTYRFNAAIRALTDSELPIGTIASESGFQSIRSFNDIFLKRTGMSPVKYRKSLSGMNQQI